MSLLKSLQNNHPTSTSEVSIHAGPLKVSNSVELDRNDIEWQFIRASGSGGQKVNKTSSAVLLVFDLNTAKLPDFYRHKLLNKSDHRISASGKILIKCQTSRSQEANRKEALEELLKLIRSVQYVAKKRIATKPSKASQRRRLDKKTQRSGTKKMRKKPQI
ncbi:alternative ribosome rescue aminoacyl-tRNA hydrolase ArfB [Gayadomonas joobiniege]|uniref:alternative ribosome rescue aminoacyl-tRNA hydrolase ArfB n=1 Tax=Gayadomonas joobiniege TaxID=1234606 RepID=UPI00037CACF4|nr:alternative ribosome rescue aminoacyl-tRNA hydrolase ArfB [Gayadomonas joobiniege]